MSKFNSTKTGTKTVTHEGGVGYSKTPELELVQFLITSMLNDKFYETEEEQLNRLKELYTACNKSDITFFPKAAIYARDSFRLRSISHMCSALIAQGIRDGVYSNYKRDNNRRSFLRNYFKKVILRADDITETISAFKSLTGDVKLPHVVKRGLSDAQAGYDEYTYAKYKQDKKEVSMMDAVRLTHTVATDKNRSALEKLVVGTLRNTTTWEATVSKAGKSENKAEAKQQAWSEFLAKGEKIEYFALLRNLRNIIEEGSKNDISQAAALLSNEKLISNSKVLPFRYLTAYKTLMYDMDVPRSIMLALNKAADLSLANVPKFSGKTLVVVDESGSMQSNLNRNVKYFDIAMMYAACLYKSNDADFMMFSDYAKYIKFNPADSVLSLATSKSADGWCTNLPSVFEKANKAYDRIIILSDFQTMGKTNAEFNAYKKKFNCDPYVYSFDLSGYKSTAFPTGNSKIIPIGGFSEAAFDVMTTSELDKNALVNEVKKIEL